MYCFYVLVVSFVILNCIQVKLFLFMLVFSFNIKNILCKCCINVVQCGADLDLRLKDLVSYALDINENKQSINQSNQSINQIC
jgi:hypothetical protein